MGTSTEHVMTIANSIIGVSVLAMPFCFKQCGIVLSILLLLLSGIMTRLACHYLLKSAISTRRRNFEFLAFHAFGPTGKLFVELGIIGFMLGTCIAFFVVMGDLGPVIIGPALNIDSFSTLRPSVLMGLGLLVVLPLGLLKNVDSLSAICAATIAFYLCLVLKVMAEATTHLLSWDWIDKVNLWRPAGIPQCIPIFSMALSCQTQLFEIFDSVPNTSLEKMNAIIKSAINMCTAVYISVGFFGYIAFCTQNFSGNLLMNFSPTVASEIIKLGFVLSVAVSFPLVIFPCRASLHSLLFRRGHTPHHELLSGGGDYIPEPRFKCLTIFIVMFSLGTGLLIPSIEVVLGLVGSTIGIMICIIFPALTFICISNKNNNERLLAQGLFAIGFIIMILGTYTNLYAIEETISKSDGEIQKIIPPALKSPSNIVQLPPVEPEVNKVEQNLINEKLIESLPNIIKEVKTQMPQEVIKETIVERIADEVDSNKRKEPPIPVAPGDNIVKESNVPQPSVITEIKESKIEKPEEKEIPKPVELKKDETISNDAIKKEEDEIKEAGVRNIDVQKKNEEILEKLSKHEEEQKKIIQEQKAVLEELKKQKLEQSNLNFIKNINTGNDIKKVDDKKSVNEESNNKINLDNELTNKKITAEKSAEPIENNNVKKVIVEKNMNSDKNDAVKNVKVENSLPVPKDKNLTPVMAKKMANGVPLPLVIKDDGPAEKIKPIAELKDNESKNTNDLKDNKPMVRDILGKNEKFIKEEREKRDLDFVEKMDETIKSRDEQPVDNVIDKTNIPAADKHNEHVMDEGLSLNIAVKDTDEENGKSLVKLLMEENKNDKENCPKPEKVEDAVVDLKINTNTSMVDEFDKKMLVESKLTDINSKDLEINEEKQKPVTEQSLIKTLSYLSQPEVPFNTGDVKVGDNIRNSLQEIKPMSRDLKSIKNTEDNRRQQERITEIT
ncbi:putative sodium-coupled neutral amino acid transporter 10 [Lycorma delicatula]|uniref:putative sodium-coupled neutral amino acid transporter 10 n=1 Tax=Lycorma delicatula TaxID=130591 RepID=UPI003F50EC55